jgi:seryl-tRNA synthetase
LKFRLKGYVEFSKDITLLESKIDAIVTKEINTLLFKRGVPKGKKGAKITRWRLKGNKLMLTIEGSRYLRPHDALLRLRTFFTERVGKNLKIGVRAIFIKDYSIQYLPSKKPEDKVEVRVPWIKELRVKDNELLVKLQNLDASAIQNRYVERILSRINEKIQAKEYIGKSERWELLWQSPKKEIAWDKDPTEEMEKRGWIKRIAAGEWLHTPIPARLMRTMQEIVRLYLLEPLEFEEVFLPKMVPLEVWLRTGHMPGSANVFYYVSRAKKWSLNEWEDLFDYIKVTGQIPSELLKEKLTAPIGGMCFAQCPPFYWFFEKKLVPDDELPIKVWDSSGTSYRWEAGGLKGLERDTEFHRIEVIWMGKKAQALEIKDQLMERYEYIFNNILDLEWRKAWVVPWYMEQAGETDFEEKKEIGTVDFEAYLPFRGSRENSEWLEFQNLTVAGTKFSEAWKFKTTSLREVWTGCTGIGLERWMIAFIAQKGLEPEEWPTKFREIVGKLPREIKTI